MCSERFFFDVVLKSFSELQLEVFPRLVKKGVDFSKKTKKKTTHFFHLSEKCLQAGWAEFFCSAVPGLCRHRETSRVRGESNFTDCWLSTLKLIYSFICSPSLLPTVSPFLIGQILSAPRLTPPFLSLSLSLPSLLLSVYQPYFQLYWYHQQKSFVTNAETTNITRLWAAAVTKHNSIKENNCIVPLIILSENIQPT